MLFDIVKASFDLLAHQFWNELQNDTVREKHGNVIDRIPVIKTLRTTEHRSSIRGLLLLQGCYV